MAGVWRIRVGHGGAASSRSPREGWLESEVSRTGVERRSSTSRGSLLSREAPRRALGFSRSQRSVWASGPRSREVSRVSEDRNWQSLCLENRRLQLEARRLRCENRFLFRQMIQGSDSEDHEATGAEALRVQLGRMQEKYRQALRYLQRCRAICRVEASDTEKAELDELLQEAEVLEEDEPLSSSQQSLAFPCSQAWEVP